MHLTCMFAHFDLRVLMLQGIEMSRAVAVVQGASRGLGLQFCRHILQDKSGASVVATCRNPQTATPLQQLKEQYPDK